MAPHDIYSLRSFYMSRSGRLIRRLLLRHILPLWPDMKGMRVMAAGYGVPYIKALRAGETERVFAVMSAAQGGVHAWPDDGPNLVALAEDADLPLETESVDRILLVHGLEFSEYPDALMDELWRVLKSNGRLMIVVPNRLGLWARADWTPFGQGRPWSIGQIQHLLSDHCFSLERTERALFMPPFRSFLMLRSAYMLESLGRVIFPGLAGLYIVEASKQIYAMRGKAGRGKARDLLRAPRALIPDRSGVMSRKKNGGQSGI